jgi:hypothetical protein
MFTTLITSVLFLALALTGVQADFSIDTPELTQCQPAHVTWDATSGPYDLIVVPESDPCGSVLVDLGDHSGTSMTWTVNIAAGTQAVFSLMDATGDEAWSGVMTVQGSNDGSCLNASPSAQNSTPSAQSSGSRTTLYVGKQTSSAPPSGSPSIVGAANAGDIPNSGPRSVGRFSHAAFALTALAAVAAFAV